MKGWRSFRFTTRARGEVKLVVDTENRLEPIRLEKILFLREDYPELFT
ncbi:MAG: hypothetical protein ACPL4E_05475 [Thermoproteota archaeon]